jgi:hypothetical protein
VEDRRARDKRSRAGLLADPTLAQYLALLDYTGRLLRKGKATIPTDAAGVFERLQTSGAAWQARLAKLAGGRLFGRFAAASRDALRRVDEQIGTRRLVNLQT